MKPEESENRVQNLAATILSLYDLEMDQKAKNQMMGRIFKMISNRLKRQRRAAWFPEE